MNDTPIDQGRVLVYPDTVASPHRISAASFLFFDKPLALPAPHWTPFEGVFQLHELIMQRRPEWGALFFRLDDLYDTQISSWRQMNQLLRPLQSTFQNILLAFDADQQAQQEGLLLLESTGDSAESVLELIDPLAAAGEFFHHVLTDVYAQLDQDAEALYSYCGELLTSTRVDQLLVQSYLPRLLLIPRFSRITEPLLLNNPRLISLLEKFPVEGNPELFQPSTDVVAWEIFCQILAIPLDPLDPTKVDRLVRIRERHLEEAERLKTKCLRLAEQLEPPTSLTDLIPTIERYIRLHVQDEISSLFELNREAFRDFLEAVFTDQKAWLATAGVIASAIAGQGTIAAGTAVATLSAMGAKAAKSAFDRGRKLRGSDYRLLYRIGRP
jgi:hypothetical protein